MRASWEALHESLGRSIRTLQADQAFLDAKHHHPALAGFGDPGAVVAHLTSKLGELDQKDRILGTLVALVQRRERHELASALLWLGLWPGLDAVYRRSLRRYRQDPDELVAELADSFIAIVERLDLRAVQRVAATLVRSTERDVLEGRKRAWAEEARIARDDGAPARDAEGDIVAASRLDELSRSAWASPPAESRLGLSAGLSFEEDVVAMRAWLEPVVGEDAELLLAVLVLDETQREAGDRMGLTHDAARKRFQRALGRLRAHIAKSLSHSAGAPRVCPPCTQRTARRTAPDERRTDPPTPGPR